MHVKNNVDYRRQLELASWRPLLSEPNVDQGYPFIFQAPPAINTRFRYYIYSTGQGPLEDGRRFSTYGSDDLIHWMRLPHHALCSPGDRAYWAPSVTYVPGLPRPYVMLYSRSIGLGEQAHVGHQILRADATDPEGPFEPTGHVLTPDFDFAIDPDVFTLSNGKRLLAFAADFVEDAPLGTGLLAAEISADLTELVSKPEALMRAAGDWQIYDGARSMPWKKIPTIDWERGDRVRWYCLEGPCGGLVSPKGRDVILYSGGCYFGFYAIGAIARDADGKFHDTSRDGTRFVATSHRTLGISATGHSSLARAPDGSQVLVFHARYDEGQRQMTLARLEWGEDDLPICRPPT